MLQLARPLNRHVDVGSLLGTELGELGADLLKVEAGHHLVKVLGQHVDLLVVLGTVGEQLDLGQHLVSLRKRRPQLDTGRGRSPFRRTTEVMPTTGC